MGTVPSSLRLFPAVSVVEGRRDDTERVRRILPSLSHRRPDLVR
jgi:hypothetical protein